MAAGIDCEFIYHECFPSLHHPEHHIQNNPLVYPLLFCLEVCISFFSFVNNVIWCSLFTIYHLFTNIGWLNYHGISNYRLLYRTKLMFGTSYSYGWAASENGTGNMMHPACKCSYRRWYMFFQDISTFSKRTKINLFIIWCRKRMV